MLYTNDTFRYSFGAPTGLSGYFSLQPSWGDPQYCVGDRGRICGTHARKRNSTGQSPAARKGFGGAGEGGAAVGARKQDPKRMGAVRRLGEVPGAILAQANGGCRVPALVLPLPRGRGNQIWRRVGGAAGNGRARQPGRWPPESLGLSLPPPSLLASAPSPSSPSPRVLKRGGRL